MAGPEVLYKRSANKAGKFTVWMCMQKGKQVVAYWGPEGRARKDLQSKTLKAGTTVEQVSCQEGSQEEQVSR
jgi:hypothetical protein